MSISLRAARVSVPVSFVWLVHSLCLYVRVEEVGLEGRAFLLLLLSLPTFTQSRHHSAHEFSSEKVHKIIDYPNVLDMDPFVSDTQLNKVSFASLNFLYLFFWQYLALINFIFVLIYPDPIRDS